MVMTFVLLAAVVALAGVLGGYLGEGFRVDLPDHHGGDGGSGRGRDQRPFNFGLAFAGGPAGALVALTFLSGPFDFRFDDLHKALSCACVEDFSDFATGLFSVVAVAILGGYLGVRLVDKFAAELLNASVREMRGEVQGVDERVDIERTIREAERQLEQGLHAQAWETLKELPGGHVRPEHMAWLRVLRGYALKRLGRMDDALREVDAAIEAKETYSAWYNRACYVALRARPAVSSVAKEVQRSLANAERLARENGGLATLHRHLKKDVEDKDSADLRELANEGFINALLERTEPRTAA